MGLCKSAVGENFFWIQNEEGEGKEAFKWHLFCFIIQSNKQPLESNCTITIFTERKSFILLITRERDAVLKFSSKIALFLKITGRISFWRFYINTKKKKTHKTCSFPKVFFLCFTFLIKKKKKKDFGWYRFIIITSYWLLKFAVLKIANITVESEFCISSMAHWPLSI